MQNRTLFHFCFAHPIAACRSFTRPDFISRFIAFKNERCASKDEQARCSETTHRAEGHTCVLVAISNRRENMGFLFNRGCRGFAARCRGAHVFVRLIFIVFGRKNNQPLCCLVVSRLTWRPVCKPMRNQAKRGDFEVRFSLSVV